MAVCLSLDHVVPFSGEVTLLQGFRKKLQHLIFPVPSTKKKKKELDEFQRFHIKL